MGEEIDDQSAQIFVVVDLSDKYVKQLTLEHAKSIAIALTNHYPERLRKLVFCNPYFGVETIINMVLYMVCDERTRAKVSFASTIEEATSIGIEESIIRQYVHFE